MRHDHYGERDVDFSYDLNELYIFMETPSSASTIPNAAADNGRTVSRLQISMVSRDVSG